MIRKAIKNIDVSSSPAVCFCSSIKVDRINNHHIRVLQISPRRALYVWEAAGLFDQLVVI